MTNPFNKIPLQVVANCISFLQPQQREECACFNYLLYLSSHHQERAGRDIRTICSLKNAQLERAFWVSLLPPWRVHVPSRHRLLISQKGRSLFKVTSNMSYVYQHYCCRGCCAGQRYQQNQRVCKLLATPHDFRLSQYDDSRYGNDVQNLIDISAFYLPFATYVIISSYIYRSTYSCS
jgi:hypothetical protein